MPKTAPQTSFNIVAKLVSWGRDGVARVEPLSDVPGVTLPLEVHTRVAEDHKRLQLIDFAFRRKQGLRVGGAVLLWRSVIEPDGTIICREVHVMRESEKDGPCVVKRNAAVFIHAPETPTSRMPKRATVAVAAEAKRVKSLDACIIEAKMMVENMAIFGKPRLILTASQSGDIEELPITIEEGSYTPEAVESAVRAGIDADSLKMITKSRTGWWLVPTFTTELEPEPHRQGKIAAQYANIDYGTADEPMWTRTNAVLRGSFSEFFLADVSPTTEPAGNAPALLLDLLPA